MKRIIIFAILVAFSSISCSDYLDENMLSGENASTITQSETGMESLVASSYIFLRVWYGKENWWDLTESGTDLYTWGADIRSAGFCTYTGWVGEEQARLTGIWYELYTSLNTVNLAIREIDGAPYSDASLRDQRKGELHFLRAHYLWLITEIWGPSHFMLEPVEEPIHTATKTSISDFYNQIFKDLDEALKYLQVGVEYGRASEPIAKAFKARLHLMWASYLKNGLTIQGQEFIAMDQGESRSQYDSALVYAEDVIRNYDYQLLSNFDDIWDISNDVNSEVIWATVFTDDIVYTSGNLMNPWADNFYSDPSLYNTAYIIQRDGGHTGHLMYEIRYEQVALGCMYRDEVNGRGFQRWMPTKFFIDLFDETVDQRFYGSFKTVWKRNGLGAPTDAATISVWKPFIFVDGEMVNVPQEKWNTPLMELGDTSIVLSKTPVPASMKGAFSATSTDYVHPEKGYTIIDINDMYNDDGTPNSTIKRQFYFPITKKYQDPTRRNPQQAYSQRDAFNIRLSEMYLIAAEAELELSNATESYNYLLELADNRSYSGNGADLLSAYNVASGADIDIDFILDERARELATEGLRFWDLKRTGKLVERVTAHNTDAGAIQKFHALRFIPQIQLDAITNKEEFKQNPGY